MMVSAWSRWRAGNLQYRLAQIYVAAAHAAAVALAVASLSASASLLIGTHKIFDLYGAVLFRIMVLIGVPIMFLTKNRNIWETEFRGCPQWLRIVSLVLLVYGVALTSAQLMLSQPGFSIKNGAPVISSIPLVFESMYIFVTYYVLHAREVDGSELIRRTQKSLVASAIVAVLLVAYRARGVP